MRFGFASAVSVPAIKLLINTIVVADIFYLGYSLLFKIMFLSSLYLEKPSKNWAPENFKESLQNGVKTIKTDLQNLTHEEAIKIPIFYGLGTIYILFVFSVKNFKVSWGPYQFIYFIFIDIKRFIGV